MIAVGAISSYDDVNSLILAGRADLCALGRSHLYDPQWTLHAAAEQGYAGPGATWPLPFAAGRRRPQGGRTDGPRPRLELIRSGTPRTAHARWRPGHPGCPSDRRGFRPRLLTAFTGPAMWMLTGERECGCDNEWPPTRGAQPAGNAGFPSTMTGSQVERRS